MDENMEKWYQSNIAVWAFCLFLPPLGLALAFVYRKSLLTKIFSVAMTLSFVSYIVTLEPNSSLTVNNRVNGRDSGYDTAKVRNSINDFIRRIENIEQQVFDIEMRYNNRVGSMSTVDRITLYNAAKECLDALTPYWQEAQNLELPNVPTNAMEKASEEARKALELSVFTRRQRCKIVMDMADEGQFKPSDMQKIKEKNKETDAWVNELVISINKLKHEAGL